MNFPFILYPDSLEKIVRSDYSYEASSLMFDRFYEASEKNSSKIIVYKPLQPSLNFKILSEIQEIHILAILCLFLIWWIVLPFLLVTSTLELLKYAGNYIEYMKAFKKYKKLLNSANEYIDYRVFYFAVRCRFEEYSLITDLELKQTILELKNARFIEISKNIIKPTSIIIQQRKGISENFFVDKLRMYFDFLDIEIITDCLVNYFFPDIILLTNTGFYIDIEIDEPYVGNTKEVIHYYESESNFYCDEARNDFFLESGWIIFRFSEQQVIKNSNSCCYEIAIGLAKLFDFDIPENKIYERLIKESFWSKETGEKLAITDYRNSYIPDELKWKFALL